MLLLSVNRRGLAGLCGLCRTPISPSRSALLKAVRRPARGGSSRVLGLALVMRRTAATATPRQAAQAAKKAFPEKLLVYHAGTPRTTFLACLKVTTIFSLAFFTFVVAPSYLNADKPLWQAAAVTLCGVVPFAVVAYTTTPFVASIHLRLPPFAQQSRDMLRRFARSVPASTPVAVTTMNLVGKPTVHEMTVADLYPVRQRLGIVNFARDPPPKSKSGGAAAAAIAAEHKAATATKKGGGGRIDEKTRKWFGRFALPPTTKFSIQSPNRDTPHGWVWDDVAACIVRRRGSPQR